MIVVLMLMLMLMLRNLRAGWIAAAMLPLSMLVAFTGMRAAGVIGNLMSLGTIDFGLVVDGAIILLAAVVLRSALEVRGATAFGEMIIALVYITLLVLPALYVRGEPVARGRRRLNIGSKRLDIGLIQL